jgi:hypothetical protein
MVRWLLVGLGNRLNTAIAPVAQSGISSPVGEGSYRARPVS